MVISRIPHGLPQPTFTESTLHYLPNHKSELFELVKQINSAAQSGDDPTLADSLVEYFRIVRQAPYLTPLEVKSLFISFNGRGQGRGESQRYPLSNEDVNAFERLREITGISTNSLEGILRTRIRATPELIKAQRERAMSRQAADLISRLEKDNAWLQDKVVQFYFEHGLEIKDLSALVNKLVRSRVPEHQIQIMEELAGSQLTPSVTVKSTELSKTEDSVLTKTLSDLLTNLSQLQYEELPDEELLTILALTNKAIPVINKTKKSCFTEVQRRFG